MSRLTKIDRYGHYYTNNANCRNIHSKDGENIEGVYFKGGVLAIDGEAIQKLAKIEDLMEEYNINSVEELKEIICKGVAIIQFLESEWGVKSLKDFKKQ